MPRLRLTLGLLLALAGSFIAHGDTVYPLALRAVTRPPLPWLPAALVVGGSCCLVASDLLRRGAARATLGLLGLAGLWVGWIILAGTSELFWLVLATSIPFAFLSLNKLLRLVGPARAAPPALPTEASKDPIP